MSRCCLDHCRCHWLGWQRSDGFGLKCWKADESVAILQHSMVAVGQLEFSLDHVLVLLFSIFSKLAHWLWDKLQNEQIVPRVHLRWADTIPVDFSWLSQNVFWAGNSVMNYTTEIRHYSWSHSKLQYCMKTHPIFRYVLTSTHKLRGDGEYSIPGLILLHKFGYRLSIHENAVVKMRSEWDSNRYNFNMRTVPCDTDFTALSITLAHRS